ncbi:MAG: hypothetical protein LWY06_10025 [Firmicutes bacterium]|nr:hypothetical protein [Bacillota bacterium]
MSLKSRIIITMAAVIAILFVPVTVLALEAKVMDVDELAKNADIILSGKVIDTTAKWEVNPQTGKKNIYTYVTLELIDVVKGKVKGNTYTFRVLGGAIPGERIAQGVVEMPAFKNGRETFLFLHNDKNLYSPVVGFYQGKFNIEIDPSSGIRKIYTDRGAPVTEFRLTKNSSKNNTDAVNYEYFKTLVESKLK